MKFKDPFAQLEIFNPIHTGIKLPFVSEGISAGGFTSPALDYIENEIDLGKLLVRNKLSTFFARVKGVSLIDLGFHEGDLVIVDRSIEPRDGCLAVFFLDGQFTMKRLRRDPKEEIVWLVPENAAMQPIRIGKDQELQVWGVMTFHIRDCKTL